MSQKFITGLQLIHRKAVFLLPNSLWLDHQTFPPDFSSLVPLHPQTPITGRTARDHILALFMHSILTKSVRQRESLAFQAVLQFHIDAVNSRLNSNHSNIN